MTDTEPADLPGQVDEVDLENEEEFDKEETTPNENIEEPEGKDDMDENPPGESEDPQDDAEETEDMDDDMD